MVKNKNSLVSNFLYIYIYRFAICLIFSLGLIFIQFNSESYASEDLFSPPKVNTKPGSGISYTDRKQIEDFSSSGIPDYSKSEVVTLPFTAPKAGIFEATGSMSQYTIFVNGNKATTGTSFQYSVGGTWTIVGKGDVITVHTTWWEGNYIYTPFK